MRAPVPFFMFCREHHRRCEEAVTTWCAAVPGSSVTDVDRYGPDDDQPEGTVRMARFVLGGQPMMAMDSAVGHEFGFTPAVSSWFECDDEAELDRLHDALTAGGGFDLVPPGGYGFSTRFAWLQDRFGVSWQLNVA